MGIAAIDRSAAPAPAHLPPPSAPESAPQLLAGTELIGRVAGSGLREPPNLVRRCDGQIVQVNLVWPVFYTDVTDSYRLTKAGRLRTDLGGVYFNALFALGAAGAYLVTGCEPLLVLVVSQQILLLDQFIPWVRLDGYHIVSDLIGVSDLFTRIKPVIVSLRPGRRADRRVTELKPWARAAVTTWVISTLAAFSAMGVVIILYAPSYLTRAWQSLLRQFDAVGYGVRAGSIVDLLNGTIGAAMLLLPVAGITLTYLLICRRTGTTLALRQARVDATLAAGPGTKTPTRPNELPLALPALWGKLDTRSNHGCEATAPKHPASGPHPKPVPPKRSHNMRDLTIHELDAQLAEQLPARELMGSSYSRHGSYTSNTAVAGNSSHGFINALNGNQVQILTFGSSNGNFAAAG